MVKKRLIITLIAFFSILVLTGFVLSIIHGNRVKAVAGITAGNENNENVEKANNENAGKPDNENQEPEGPKFDYNDAETYYRYMENQLRYLRTVGDPNFMADWEVPDLETVSQKVFSKGRDELYAENNFTGTYVKDETCSLSKIPYYSADDIFFNVNVFSFALGGDSCKFEYKENDDSRLYWVMKSIPTEEIRERADGARYLVYDTDDNCRLFVMLSQDSPRAIVVGYPILYKNELSYKDFSNIQPGATLTEVSAIDDICEYYRRVWFEMQHANEYNFAERDGRRSDLATIHYLTDGLLKIGYGSLNADGDPVVNYVEFYPDYVMQTWNMKDLDYRIVPLDLQK